jgi:hypothetical protein
MVTSGSCLAFSSCVYAQKQLREGISRPIPTTTQAYTPLNELHISLCPRMQEMKMFFTAPLDMRTFVRKRRWVWCCHCSNSYERTLLLDEEDKELAQHHERAHRVLSNLCSLGEAKSLMTCVFMCSSLTGCGCEAKTEVSRVEGMRLLSMCIIKTILLDGANREQPAVSLPCLAQRPCLGAHAQ